MLHGPTEFGSRTNGRACLQTRRISRLQTRAIFQLSRQNGRRLMGADESQRPQLGRARVGVNQQTLMLGGKPVVER